MTFRDDRDALREQVDSLQRELAAAQGEAERAKRLEAELDQTRAQLDRIAGEVARMRPSAPRRGPIVAVAVAGVVAAGAAAAVLVVRAPPRPTPAPAASTAPPPPRCSPGDPLCDPPRSAPTVAATTATPAAPAKRVHWKATVSKSKGQPLARGARCEIVAELRGQGQSAEIDDVEIRCGDRALYRSSDGLAGMASIGWDIGESAGAPTLVYNDQGTRTGPRTQASINTPAGVAAAWADTLPDFRVELAISGRPDVEP